MGKKTKAVSAKKLVTVSLPAETQQQFAALKEQGNKHFTENQYSKAVEEYERARVIPHTNSDAVDLALRKSACYYKLKRFKDAVKECDAALSLQPAHATALKRRAQAYEQLGLLKNALSDYQRVNRTESGTDETRAAEKRLKDVMTGKKGSGEVLGLSRGLQRQAPKNSYQQFTVKCTLGSESRLVHVTPTTTYGELLGFVQAKYPTAGPFVLKYVDREGDLVTITERMDIQRALSELLAATDRQAITRAQVPALRVEVVPVADQSLVPVPRQDEEIERQQLQAKLLEDFLKSKGFGGNNQQLQSASQAPAQPGEVYELDEWLSDFIDLFAQVTNIDPFRAEHLSNLGQEETQRGIHQALQKEEAVRILHKAAERFKESTCSGLLQWGNTHMYLASKLQESGDKSEENCKAIEAEMSIAEKKYLTALEYKPDFWEGLCSLGHLEFERAKVAAGLLFKLPTLDPVAQEGEKPPQEPKEATSEPLKQALSKLDKESVQRATPHFDKSNTWFAEALKVVGTGAPVEDAPTENGDKGVEGEADDKVADSPQPGDPQYQPADQVQIMHGNTLYEWSQILAAVGEDWQPTLDSAVGLFKNAGCTKADVRTALKNHTQAEQLDLGPEPEPEAAPPPEPATEPKPTQVPEKKLEAKGLPGLGVRKKEVK